MRGSVLTNKERCYVIGMFIGDGYAVYDKSRHYRVDFSLNSKRDIEVIRYLKFLLKKAGYNSFDVYDKRYNAVYVRVNSKILMHYLVGQKNELRAKKIVNNRQKVLGLLSGLIDSEGYVGHGEILLSQKDNSVARLMQNLSDFLGLTTSVRHVPNPKGSYIWRIRVSTKFKKLSHVSQKVLREYV